jgi:hypothetical protein
MELISYRSVFYKQVVPMGLFLFYSSIGPPVYSKEKREMNSVGVSS